MRFVRIFAVLCLFCLFVTDGFAKKKKDEDKQDTITSSVFSGLKWRSVGPAYTSGRIADFAVNPDNISEYYVGVACGHIWKTTNNGNTWTPVFDNYASYSIGCLAMDPENHNVVWAGTGENNHQRALAYGDGVYKTIDGGKTWKNMGLKDSRQIGKILIDPRDTDVVYVAAEGSAWGPGGDRGLYKTTDGGENWEKVLEISKHTGVNDMLMDPRDPDVIYASAEQRRRHVHTKIGGGPESAIYKTTDGGKNWKKLTSGLPSGNVGGMGLAISPANPDVVYAIIEAEGESGGFFRSQNRGASWKKMSSHHASGQYYNEIYCDPLDVDKVYSMETYSHYTDDGGKTWHRLSNKARHVDDHAMWIDPSNTNHFMIGGDGGVYESFDGGDNYYFKENLPVTQFYRVNVDNDYPFYNIYGGTQDNSSMGGPSQNTSSQGVTSCEWYVTNGGDGFWTAVDPDNPDIVYAESQYGNLVRYDRITGRSLYIRPQPRKGEETYKWNWNTPFFISPHSKTRLYVAANKVFKSDDRGGSWDLISEDLSRGIDRNHWKVMDKYWSIDAVKKDVSTSLFGTIVSLCESPLQENLLYAGTDDGQISITEDLKEWIKITSFPGVPEYTYVSDIFASPHDANTVFAAFDNRKRDDFKPYLLKSNDKGKTWISIADGLPENGTVHSIAQDPVKKELLFAGTEFGLFFSFNGGEKWIQLKSGIPTIAIRDMAIQEREDDLVVATFGRGFYVLDDYSPLRQFSPDMMNEKAHIFDIKDALMYHFSRGKYGQGSDYYSAKNPPFGAVFTWYLDEVPKTKKQIRKKKEKELFEKGEPIPIPDDETLRAEEEEIPPYLMFTITDSQGNIVRKLYEKPSKGINRTNWNLRYQGTSPVSLKNNEFNPFSDGNDGMNALPGTYFLSMSIVHDGKTTDLAGPVEFDTKVLGQGVFPAQDRKKLTAFQDNIAEMYRAMEGSRRLINNLQKRINYITQAIHNSPDAGNGMMSDALNIKKELKGIELLINGKTPKASSEEIPPVQASLNSRMGFLLWSMWSADTDVSASQENVYNILKQEFPPVLDDITRIATQDIPALEKQLDNINAPWTPGRIPQLK